MGAGHGHSSAAIQHRWRLVVAFVLVAGFFVVELVAGLVAESLALLSDAGHMAADVVTLGAALVATRVAARPDHTGRRTYGSYRAEVFASGLAVLVMMAVSVYIGLEAIARIGQEAEPVVGVMLVVGALGLVVNLVALVLLRGGAGESLNIKGAYLEVMADTLGSVGVIGAALLVAWTEQAVWDTVIALVIAVFVLVRALLLGREVIAVLGQHAPKNVEPAELLDALESLPGVRGVHDLHIWTLTSGMNVATAHLATTAEAESPAVLEAASRTLSARFGIAHATLQIEAPDQTCHGASW